MHNDLRLLSLLFKKKKLQGFEYRKAPMRKAIRSVLCLLLISGMMTSAYSYGRLV